MENNFRDTELVVLIKKIAKEAAREAVEEALYDYKQNSNMPLEEVLDIIETEIRKIYTRGDNAKSI